MEEAADLAVSLPDDALLEILFRVKDVPAALFRCSRTCKRWRGLIADLSFLRRCWLSFSLVGFIAMEWLVPVPGSDLGRGLCALRSFVPALPAGAAPLISRHGLLLLRLDSDPTVVRLAVCNLHLGTCRMLPLLSSCYLANYGLSDNLEVNSYAILCGADCRSGDDPTLQSLWSVFKVVIIGYHRGDNRYHLHTFSSHETTWSVRIDCFKKAAMGFFSDAVVCRGTAHWIFGNWFDERFYVIDYNIKTRHISSTKLPAPFSSISAGFHNRSRQCLALANNDEALSLLHVQQTGPHIEIWTQQDDPNNMGSIAGWLCTGTIKLNRSEESLKLDLYLLGDKCGTLLLCDCLRRVYTANLETGTMERVVDWPQPPRGRYVKPAEAVPLEMDWPALFVSRLGS